MHMSIYFNLYVAYSNPHNFVEDNEKSNFYDRVIDSLVETSPIKKMLIR